MWRGILFGGCQRGMYAFGASTEIVDTRIIASRAQRNNKKHNVRKMCILPKPGTDGASEGTSAQMGARKNNPGPLGGTRRQ